VTRKKIIVGATILLAIIGVYFLLQGKPDPAARKPRVVTQAVKTVLAQKKQSP